jgi:hypothetical protein
LTWAQYKLLIQGVGRGVIAAAFLHPFQKCIGIEYLENLHKVAFEVKATYDIKCESLRKTNEEYIPFNKMADIIIENGDFLKYDWRDASLLLANSTCFSVDLMTALGKKADAELKKGTIFVTFTKRLPNLNEEWEIKDGFRRIMSWGIATVYIHRKLI